MLKDNRRVNRTPKEDGRRRQSDILWCYEISFHQVGMIITFSTDLERRQMRDKRRSWPWIGIYAFMKKYLASVLFH